MSWGYKKQKYQNYLQSEIWQNKRQHLFDLLGKACEICGGTEIIQVHHLTYERLYRERKSDLLLLCAKCHKVADGNRKRYKLQKHFARWVYENYGDSWRGKISFLDMIKKLAVVYNQNPDEIKTIFEVKL